MSKIEEALNKASKNKIASTGLRVIKRDDSDSLPSHFPAADVRAPSDSQEIALMNEEHLLDAEELSELGVITAGMNDNALANNYRDIRTKLIHKSQGKNFVVMVTSCVPEDDGSNFTLNLATAFTFDESKTSLLIDCNLHHSHLESKFNFDLQPGLTDYLKGDNIDVESIVRSVGIKRLRMIPTGTQKESATEYFTSLKMRELMESLLARYTDRYIFINSAPVKESADTRILIDLCDYVILTVPYGSSTLNGIKDAVDSIEREKLLGVIFNEIPNLPKFEKSGFGTSKA